VLPLLGRPVADAAALDVGCGVGRVTRALAARFGSVTGVDVSDEMVARATELHPTEAYPNLRFAASDGLTLPLADESVDFAFSYEVVQHMPSHEVIERNLRELARVLRPDGLALVHVHTPDVSAASVRSGLARLLPDRLVRLLKTAVLRQDPLTIDATFRGAPPLPPGELPAFFGRARLDVVELRPDPTHRPGSRTFVAARRAA
jgi:ubiquinone/menaquinone biosynthesis C-methylase UbiE